ncbi:MAG: magnesium transporter CorA family protein [Planctomycetes bacterium]|nr:magnesium transporter CorA family protein [Planctomycetota bacterium]
MIIAWMPSERGLTKFDGPIVDSIPVQAVWLDLVDITRDEEILVEKLMGIDIPTRAEMQEIEVSSRLYRQGPVSYMTATHLIKTETENPETSAVTFILCRDRLVTLRYAEPWSFRTFAQRAGKSGAVTAEHVFVHLMEITVERLADLLELVSIELEHLSQQIFRRRQGDVEVDLQRAIFKIGTCGNIGGKVRESLLDKNRVVTFSEQATQDWMSPDARSRLKAAQHDIQSLSDHATFTASKINFLLDATLGLISMEQNRIIKIFSIAAVIFMPPTLVASIYGMNFKRGMHELEWKYGYEFALGLILLSVIITLWFFKRKKWL